MTTKLELVNHGYLDLATDVPLALNFNLNDIRDISNRGGVWSKTIKIPGTSNNNQILGNVFNTNINTLTFNPVIKEPCRIIVDGMNTFEGVFQIRKINKNFKNSQDFKVEYNCYIKSDTSSFYESISGKYLDQIDISQFNHTWDITTATTSMNSGIWSDGYQYFLSYNRNSDLDYQPQDLIPAIYAKIYWDEIFSDAGYTYEWDELYPLNFDKLIIPYNGEKFKGSVDQQYRFKAGISSQYEYWLASTRPDNNPNVQNSTDFATNNISPVSNGRAPVIFNDDSTSPWNDPNSLYSITTGQYDVSNFNGSMEFNTKYDVSLQVEMEAIIPGTTSSNIYAQEGFAEVYLRNTLRVYDGNNNQLGILSSYNTDIISFSSNDMTIAFSTEFKVEAALLSVDHNSIFSTQDYPTAAYVKNIVEFKSNTDGQSTWRGFKDGAIRYKGYFYSVFYPQSDETGHFNNQPETAIVSGSPMNMNDIIPRKIKQSDFILSIIKMFNLYIREDKHDPNKLIIKTRDKFYDDGVELDWTDKLDIKSVDVEILSNTQKKRKKFTYKDDDKDDVAVVYKDHTKETFGQLEYIFENEFIKDIDEVQPIFSPTLIVNGYKRGSNLLLPYIDSRSPKNNIRIVFSGDVLNGYWYYNKDGINEPGYFFQKSTYRYAGHLWPNPINPTQDINYGVCDYYSHPYNTMTDNNLYNRFYSSQMDILENGHMMTAHFYLTYTDILKINLDERIYVYDSWWNINEIIDFDLNSEKLTKVELVTADPQIDRFTPNNDTFIANNKPNAVNEVINRVPGDNVIGTGVTGVLIGGDDNTVQPGSSNDLILGRKNKVDGNNNIISGKNNTVSGNNVNILGRNNMNIPDSNITYVNSLVPALDIIDAGRDTILNHFPQNMVVNILDAGRDEIRPLGGYTIVSLIQAGRDSVL